MSFDDRNFNDNRVPNDEMDGAMQEKPTKAIIGLGVLLVLGVLLYQVNNFTGADNNNPQQNVAQRSMTAPQPQSSPN